MPGTAPPPGDGAHSDDPDPRAGIDPAGWPRGARPRVSVIIPAYNAEAALGECLARAFASTYPDFEVILVDDGSTDGTREVAARFPARIVSTPGRVGPAAARNLGAGEAGGEILFFIDADVMLRPDSIDRLVRRLGEGDVDAVCGVQDAAMRHRNLASTYKNLWIRWTYLRCAGDVPLFYTTAAAIRRGAFRRAGGFDAGYRTPSLEDTAFGQALARSGVRVRVQPDLEVEHVKRYSLGSMLRTDFRRAVALVRLKLRHRGELGRNNSSVPTGYIASLPLAAAGTAAMAAGAALARPGLLAAGLALAAVVIGLNREFLRAIRDHAGRRAAMGAAGLLWLELLVAGVGAGCGLLGFPLGNRY